MHRQSPTIPSECDLCHWLFQLRRCQHANCAVLRPPLCPNSTHLLVLYCLCAHLQLAAHHHHISFPPLPRKEEKRAPEPNRLLRLRSRSTPAGHDLVHCVVLPPTNSHRILPDICLCANVNNLVEGDSRHMPCVLEPFPSLRVNASYQGFKTLTRFVYPLALALSILKSH